MLLFEIVGVTSIELTYYVGFSILTSEEKKNSLGFYKIVMIFRSVKTITQRWLWLTGISNWWILSSMFSLNYCFSVQFHISKNVKAKCNTDCKVKEKYYQEVDGKEKNSYEVDGNNKEVKEVKSKKLVNNIVKSWENVVESTSKESYVEVVVQFW